MISRHLPSLADFSIWFKGIASIAWGAGSLGPAKEYPVR